VFDTATLLPKFDPTPTCNAIGKSAAMIVCVSTLKFVSCEKLCTLIVPSLNETITLPFSAASIATIVVPRATSKITGSSTNAWMLLNAVSVRPAVN
jgi:hypothetical protein